MEREEELMRKVTKEEVFLVHKAAEAEMKAFQSGKTKAISLGALCRKYRIEKQKATSSEIKKGARPRK